MEFLTKELTNIGGFSIALWHVLVAVATVVLLIIIIVAICTSARKKSNANVAPQEPTVEPVVVVEDPVEPDPTDDPNVVVVDDTDVDDTDPTVVVVDEPADQPTAVVVEVVEPVEEVVEPTDEPTETPTETPAHPKKPTVKNYHISLRPDGKWQVKLSKGGKAIKLFNTQAEAIAFAKARAKSQDGHITIHKVDGRIRKQKY